MEAGRPELIVSDTLLRASTHVIKDGHEHTHAINLVKCLLGIAPSKGRICGFDRDLASEQEEHSLSGQGAVQAQLGKSGSVARTAAQSLD